MSNVRHLYIDNSGFECSSKKDLVKALTAALQSIAFKLDVLGDALFVRLDDPENVQDRTDQTYTADIVVYISLTYPRTVSTGAYIGGSLNLGSEDLGEIKVSLSLLFLDESLS